MNRFSSRLRQHHPGIIQRWPDDEAAVSEILGTLLIVALTVASAAAFGLFLNSIDAPDAAGAPDVEVFLSPGTDGWATGDEQLMLRHVGGRALDSSEVEIRITTSGSQRDLMGADLGGDFADGRWSIGDSWTTMIRADEGTVLVQFLDRADGAGRVIFDGPAASFGGTNP